MRFNKIFQVNIKLRKIHKILIQYGASMLLWSSTLARCDSSPQFKCQNFSILANCLVKGQQAFEIETHGGCSLDVLRAAGAY